MERETNEKQKSGRRWGRRSGAASKARFSGGSLLLVVTVVIALSFALPAFGAPSPLSVAKRALKLAQQADKRSRQALSIARGGTGQVRTEAKKKKATTKAGPPGPVSYTHLTLPTTPYV